MVAQAEESTEQTQLLHDAMAAAAQTLNQQKIDGLARALANGLRNDGAHVDEEQLIVRALADLEPVHVKALLCGWEGHLTKPITRFSLSPAVGDTSVGPVLAVLERHGLVYQDETERANALAQFLRRNERDSHNRASMGVLQWTPGQMPGTFTYDDMWTTTPFAKRCLDYLDALPTDRPEDGTDGEV